MHTLDIKYQNKITLKLDGQEDDDNKYLKKNLRMPKSEALKYIDKYPNRTICVEYIVKDIQVNEPERKGIFGATDFIFAADIINYSFTRGPCA